MEFKLVAFGAALLVVGLAAYASIPTVHTTTVSSWQDVWVQSGFPIQAGSLVEQPKNITMFSSMANILHANFSVSSPGREATSVRFELLRMNSTESCSPSSKPPTIFVDQIVSNQSLSIPLNETGTYCFLFDNQNSQTWKNVDISARTEGSTQRILIARDGSANTVGLGLGALGLVVAVYGYSRRTVIPWE